MLLKALKSQRSSAAAASPVVSTRNARANKGNSSKSGGCAFHFISLNFEDSQLDKKASSSDRKSRHESRSRRDVPDKDEHRHDRERERKHSHKHDHDREHDREHKHEHKRESKREHEQPEPVTSKKQGEDGFNPALLEKVADACCTCSPSFSVKVS
jgi:hypothetical protein